MGSKQSGPSKYTAEVHTTIIKHLEAGAFKKHAANAAGVSDDALAEWLRLGAAGQEPYVQFAADVEAAIARDAIRNQSIISKAAIGAHAGDWKAAAWNLERKHPRLYKPQPEAVVQPAAAPVERPFSPWLDKQQGAH